MVWVTQFTYCTVWSLASWPHNNSKYSRLREWLLDYHSPLLPRSNSHFSIPVPVTKLDHAHSNSCGIPRLNGKRESHSWCRPAVVNKETKKPAITDNTSSSAAAEIARVGGHYAIQSHSKSVILIPIDNPYCTVNNTNLRKLLQIIDQIFADDSTGVPIFKTLVRGEPLHKNYQIWPQETDIAPSYGAKSISIP